MVLSLYTSIHCNVCLSLSVLQLSLSQIKEVDSQLNQLIEKRMMRNDPMDDKLTLYRQQVTVMLCDVNLCSPRTRAHNEQTGTHTFLYFVKNQCIDVLDYCFICKEGRDRSAQVFLLSYLLVKELKHQSHTLTQTTQGSGRPAAL